MGGSLILVPRRGDIAYAGFFILIVMMTGLDLESTHQDKVNTSISVRRIAWQRRKTKDERRKTKEERRS